MTDTTLCTGKTCHGDSTNPYRARPGTLLCSGCTRRLERHLAELPARLHLIQALYDGRQTPRRTDRPGGDPPVPLHVDAYDLLNSAPAVLGSWAQMVCEERHLRGPDDPNRLSAWLLGQLDWLVQQPWVDDFEDEIHDLARTAEALGKSDKHRYRLEPPCPSCGAMELGRWDGTEQVDCASCGRAWPRDEYKWMVRLALDDSGGCLTTQEAASRLGVTVGTLRNYVSSGQIRKLGTVDGAARYSARDVDELLRQDGAA